VDKSSLETLIRLTVDKDEDICLYSRKFLRKFSNTPLRIKYSGNSSLFISIDVTVKFGREIGKTLDRLSKSLSENLLNLAGVQIKSLELNVKDIFDEKEVD